MVFSGLLDWETMKKQRAEREADEEEAKKVKKVEIKPTPRSSTKPIFSGSPGTSY